MIDPKILRAQYDLIESTLKKRGYPVMYLETYRHVDDEWRKALQEVEALRARQKQLTPKGKPSSTQLTELANLSSEIKFKNDGLLAWEQRVLEAAYQIPNLLLPDVPVGESEADNVEVRRWAAPWPFDFDVLSHDVLAERLDLIDFNRATKVTGARFSIFKGMGAKLERGIMNLMLDLHTTEHGYTELLSPALVNTDSLFGTGQLPKFSEDQFKVLDTDYWLSPTAEVQLTNYYRNEIIDEDKLPIKLTGYTPCFRKEAGSYGKDMKGLIRQHQFDKVEMVQLVRPEDSEAALEGLVANAEHVLQVLNLPYRVVKLCSKDTSFCSAKTYDLEVWMPSQGKYREISSCSNFLDFQARRAMLRYKLKSNGSTAYLHTLNGSGLAIGRTFAAILENYQQKDGRVLIPSVLQKWMGVEELF